MKKWKIEAFNIIHNHFVDHGDLYKDNDVVPGSWKHPSMLMQHNIEKLLDEIWEDFNEDQGELCEEAYIEGWEDGHQQGYKRGLKKRRGHEIQKETDHSRS